jgi:hypothetical protein
MSSLIIWTRKILGERERGGGGTDTRPSSPLPPVFSRLSPLGQLTPCIPSCLKESDESQLSGLSRLNSGSKRWPSGPAFLAWYVFSCLTPLSGLSWLRFGQFRPEAKVSVTEFSLPRPLPAKFRDWNSGFSPGYSPNVQWRHLPKFPPLNFLHGDNKPFRMHGFYTLATTSWLVKVGYDACFYTSQPILHQRLYYSHSMYIEHCTEVLVRFTLNMHHTYMGHQYYFINV